MSINKKITSLVVSAGLFCVAPLVFAQIDDPSSYSDFSTMLMNIVTKVLQLIGTLGTIMFIVSGIIYIFSFGSPQAMEKGKKALFYAIIGMVVGLAATAIVAWIKSVIS